jgi:hypothetical protein
MTFVSDLGSQDKMAIRHMSVLFGPSVRISIGTGLLGCRLFYRLLVLSELSWNTQTERTFRLDCRRLNGLHPAIL